MGGTLLIRRRYRLGNSLDGARRYIVIHRRSGVFKKAELGRIATVLDLLYRRGEFEILQNVADGLLSPLEVLSKWDDRDTLPSREGTQKITPTVFDWLKTATDRHGKPLAAGTKRGYRVAFIQLLKFAPENATISTLPAVLRKMRDDYGRVGKARTYNQTRSALQAFLRSSFGRQHELHTAISAVERLDEVTHRRPGNPLSVSDALRYVAELPADSAGIFATLLFTGMSPKEIAGNWEIDGHLAHIHGTKRQSRERTVPLMVSAAQLVKPIGTYTDDPNGLAWYARLRQALRRVGKRFHKRDKCPEKFGQGSCKHEVLVYDTRRTFARWMSEAGLLLEMQSVYMGHARGAMGMTGLYKHHAPSNDELERDRKLLLNFLRRERKRALHLRIA